MIFVLPLLILMRERAEVMERAISMSALFCCPIRVLSRTCPAHKKGQVSMTGRPSKGMGLSTGWPLWSYPWRGFHNLTQWPAGNSNKNKGLGMAYVLHRIVVAG